MWIRFFLFIGLILSLGCRTSVDASDERQVIAEAYTSYHSFHSIDVRSQVFADSEESILFEEEDGDLWIRLLFSDKSRRSAVQSNINIRLWEDVNYPKSPSNWVEKFNKEVAEGSGVAVDSSRTFTKQSYVKLPGSLFDRAKSIHRVKLEISLQTSVKFGWATRQSQSSKTFFLSHYPKFSGKRLKTRSIQKLNNWAYSRNIMLQDIMNVFRDFMDPTYKIKDGEWPQKRALRYLNNVNQYTNTYFDEVDFKAYMSEFVTAYSRGIEEKIEFPVQVDQFLNIPDKDFDLKTLMMEVNRQIDEMPRTIKNSRHYLALIKLVGIELDLLPKIFQLRSLSEKELERLSVFQNINSRNGYIERLSMLKKNSLKQQDAYDAIGQDLKRVLGWNSNVKSWNALEQSPIYRLANSEIFSSKQDQLVAREVIQAVRALYYSMFFILGSELYFSKILTEVIDAAMAVFQLAPPEISFRLDNEILFNGEEGVLIARVHNPSRYLALKNVHLLMEKNNLRRLMFYRGDNMQSLDLIKPQEVKYVFFRFSTIGIGTDYPTILVRYNQDFETVVRVDPIAVKRKDEFLTEAMQKVENFTQKDVVNSYSRLKDRLKSFQEKLNNMNWEKVPQRQ
tara:strand:- start:5160 stop:7019 length:1860 start_codon:yes stop_codon:yes gene_type:complete